MRTAGGIQMWWTDNPLRCHSEHSLGMTSNGENKHETS